MLKALKNFKEQGIKIKKLEKLVESMGNTIIASIKKDFKKDLHIHIQKCKIHNLEKELMKSYKNFMCINYN